MLGDAEDGYDTTEWLANQDWSNGNIGTYGCSYRGAVQLYQAGLRNPHLKAMIPQAAPGGGLGFAGGEARFLGIRSGGAFELANTFSFFWNSGSKIHYKAPSGTPAEIRKYFDPTPTLPEINLREVLWSLPLKELPDRFGAPPTDWNDVLTRDPDDPWWKSGGYLDDEARPDVPTLSINSWYDPNIAHTLYRFNLFRNNSVSERARNNQFVIISPTQHCQSEQATAHTVVGERDMGDARLGHTDIYLEWFDYWLKGIGSDILKMPRVQYFLMGKNEWRAADSWPIPGTRFTIFFLDSRGAANSRFGAGTLTVAPPGPESTADRYTYDPAAPVPSLVGPSGAYGGGPMAGPVDNRDVEMRHDVLVYSTAPLDSDVEITGPVRIELYVSSSAPDTDFTAKLLDVYPDGRAFNLTEGILRARYRNGHDTQVWMEPNEIYKVSFDLRPTSNTFFRGHSIRLEVSSSNFPQYDRNLNTGGNNYDETSWLIANNSVYHSSDYPSFLLLPVIPASTRDRGEGD
jgi:putative CocE/NonD family hydrolase